MKNRILLSGNEAIAKALLDGKSDFFAAYPITPASEISQSLVKSKIKFMQAEDEIAAINMAIGASLAGKKSATATSGPGFSLMQESIGYAFKIGVPLLIINSQRVGPSTGMPTFGSQGDILQAAHGSHGDYINIVFYPNSVEECYKYTIEALNAAEESLSPIILLTDGFISKMYETVSLSDVDLISRKLLPLGKAKRHFTGLTSKDNLPLTKDPEIYREWYKKRKQEILNISKKYSFYEYLENKKSDTLLIAYGISSRVILPLKEKYSIFRPIRMFPVIEELKEIANKYNNIIIIEMNDGQYKHELEAFLKREIKLISQLGGKISLIEIKNEIAKLC